MKTCWLFLLTLFSSLCLSAQNQPVVPVQDQALSIVENIEINFTGPRSLTPEYILANIQIAKGGPYTNAKLDQSIRALYETELIEFVESRVEKLPNDKVKVIFDIKSKYRIKNTLFRGNEKIKSDRFLHKDTDKGISSVPGKFLDELKVKEDRDFILELYRKRGYANITVDYEVIRDAERATIVFNIDEGSKIKIKRVDFTGNAEIREGKLRKVVDTRRWTPLSWFRDTGKYREETLSEDIDKLREFYKEKGYLDVQVSEKDI
ncbi:MAG: POTRA domain-containing protein, partial [Opitutae bacterium]